MLLSSEVPPARSDLQSGAGPAAVRAEGITSGWWRAALLLWLLSAPVLCLLYMKIEPSPDQAQFDYMGWLATQGRPFYGGSFDMNWPGAMILHELAIRLFGPQPWSWHLFDFLLLEAISLGLALFLRRAGFALGSAIVLVIYPPVYVTAGGWMAGQRDIIAVGLLGVACALLLPTRPVSARPAQADPVPADPAAGRALLGCACAGALAAAAMLIRPTYLPALVGFVALEFLPRSWLPRAELSRAGLSQDLGWARRHSAPARAGAIAVGFAAVLLAVLAAGEMIGNLDDFWQQSFRFVGSVYAGDPPQDMGRTARDLFFHSWHWLTLLGGAGIILWIWRDRGLGYPVVLVVGLMATITLSYVVQRKGFGYHLGGFVPLLTLLTAVAIDRLFALRRAAAGGMRWLATGIALCAALLVATGTLAKIVNHRTELLDLRHGLGPIAGHYGIPAPVQAQMIALIRARSAPDAPMVLYGTAYQIPYLAERLPSYRFITPAVEQMTPSFALYPAWISEIEAGLRNQPPTFVLITKASFSRDSTGLLIASQPDLPVLSRLLQHVSTGYEIVLQGPFGTLFERTAK